ncbi:probable U3 small nucleolar RNA-associated protein 13 [Callorhinchus milii]|uniref:probable U3 small nucleolar RNA-associated protein 13 n=1 Tax=Callorhinchus milii TaxID=7868 RepID=UPI001C3FE63B|nr:probable U3 small nucleolar RNA-associated protein 13 [Callorhinchus milii]
MSMQQHLTITDCHSRSVSALGYHTARREFLTGFEDGVIKWWDLETGKMTCVAQEHTGIITQFLYWAEPKLLFSASNDGTIVIWNVAATVFDRIVLNAAVFCMAICYRRHQIICGFKKRLRVFPLDEKKESGHVIDLKRSFSDHRHSDIVSCVVCLDTRVFSAGYDKKLIVYETSSNPSNKPLQVVHCNPSAHEAGITCLLVVQEHESTRLVTGSFDRAIKVWSQDGQLIQKLHHLPGTVSSLCFVPCVNVVWICSGVRVPTLFDPSSGEIVSESIDTFQKHRNGPRLNQVICPPETNHVIGFTIQQKAVSVWKYNKQGCVTALQSRQPVECLSYTQKVPILLFSGHRDGTVLKWERHQSSYFLYSHEAFNLLDEQSKGEESHNNKTQWRKTTYNKTHHTYWTAGSKLSKVQKSADTRTPNQVKRPRFTRSVFVEELDLLALAAEDGKVYLWGFDDSLSSILKMMPSKAKLQQDRIRRFEVLLDQTPKDHLFDLKDNENDADSVTNRVSGFVCKKVLSGHLQLVTGLALVARGGSSNTNYLISGGWDGRLCVWDLQTGALKDTFCHTASDSQSEVQDLANDGAILDLAYSPKRNEFAYSSSEGMVYLRRFSPVAAQMILVNVLRGHEADITSVVWHSRLEKWLSGSEDGTIRIWSEDGMQCEQVLVTHGAVSCLCVDQVNGCIVAGIQEIMRVYDAETFIQVQSNTGHTDCIRTIIHIPERKQYISASWDNTVRVWNAYIKCLPRTRNPTGNAI